MASVAALSAIVRSVVAWQHSTPRYFPDEYIYAALGRSIGHGHLAIRGHTTFFPGIVEPVLAAPLWRLFDTTTAYHLVQVENAVVASLAAIPVYLLARQLGMRSAWALCAAVYAVALPSLVLVAYTMSDTIAYTLALSAAAAAVAALHEPTRRRQLLFLLFATLVSLTRVEYFAVVPAYAAAALALDGRRAVRRHAFAFAALAPAAGALLLGAFGYYNQGLHETRINLRYAKWFGIQPFLLALEAGAAIVPGAVAGIAGARGRRAVGFACFVGTFAVLLVAEATAHAADSLQFKERYLFVLLALLPIAFSLYAREPRRRRLVVVGVAVAIVVAAARLPLSGYDAATYKSDSQFLLAVGDLENWLGVANTSLMVAVIGTIGAALAVATAFRGRLWTVPAFAFVVAVALTVQASRVDVRSTNAIRAGYPGSLTWIDDAAHAPVTAVATPLSPASDLLSEIWWNQSVQREAVLDDGAPTDAFTYTKVKPARDGTLRGVSGDVLLDDYGTTAVLADATPIAHSTNFTLWRPRGAARLRTLIEGRFYDSFLADKGSIRVWPQRVGAGVEATFRLSLPASWPKTSSIDLGGKTVVLRPGGAVAVACGSATGPLHVRFSSQTVVLSYSAFFRRLAAKLTQFEARDVPRGTARSGCRVLAGVPASAGLAA